MKPHSMKSPVSPDNIWQELESDHIHQGEDFLSERSVAKHSGVDIFLGLVAKTNERTVHLRLPIDQASGFCLSFVPSGLWVKPFIFTDHAILAVVLTDDELQPQFSQFAAEFIRQLGVAGDRRSVLNLLTGHLAGWQPASDCLRAA